MSNLPEVKSWVQLLIPDLDSRVGAFEVDTCFLDDELIEAFKEEVSEQYKLLQDGLETLEYEKVRRAAHSIKGMGGTLGLPEISVLAQEIEFRAKSEDPSNCDSLVIEFIKWAKDFVGE